MRGRGCGAVGDVTEWLAGAAPDALTRALVMAARHERLDVIDRLLALGTPVDAVDPVFGGHPLRAAAQAGRPGSVGQLLAAGADPNRETTAVGRPWTSAGRVSQSTRASTAIARSRPPRPDHRSHLRRLAPEA